MNGSLQNGIRSWYAEINDCVSVQAEECFSLIVILHQECFISP